MVEVPHPSEGYCLKDATQVPSVTEVIGVLDKGRALLLWANRQGLKGIPLNRLNANAQESGTLLHKIVLDAILARAQLQPLADPALGQPYHSARLWMEDHTIEPVSVEEQYISEKHGFGGTPDLVSITDGRLVVQDIKSSKTVYREHRLQVAAYFHLLHENGLPVESAWVLALGGGYPIYEEVWARHLEMYWEVFLHMLSAYRLLKQIGD